MLQGGSSEVGSTDGRSLTLPYECPTVSNGGGGSAI